MILELNKFTSHDIVEYFTCQKRFYHFKKYGCTTVHMAKYMREYLRTIQAFSTSTIMKNAHYITSENIEEATQHSQKLLVVQKDVQPKCTAISNVIISSDNTLFSYIPLCTWNSSSQSWVLHFPTSVAGLKQEQKIHAACALYTCEKLSIPVSRVVLHALIVNEEDRYLSDYGWHESDITGAVQKYAKNLESTIEELLSIATFSDESMWKSCGKRYCDACGIDSSYDVDDVRTLRKSKQIVDALLEQNITSIQDIPSSIDFHLSAQRQIQAVQENKSLFFKKEIQNFLYKLIYPRYYLDFEGVSTAVPMFPSVKVWGFVPFLFSLQWQDNNDEVIHTQLWGMSDTVDKRLLMWQQLKDALLKAGSIIVYSRNFEDEMIRQLAQLANESHIGEIIIRKIVDLQSIFFYLSIYHPLQKGKISLKTLALVWLECDYSSFIVQEGMEANYFFTVISDEKQRTFEPLLSNPYLLYLHQAMSFFDNKKQITLKDIAEYCKYDTMVMIRIVALLEKKI